jgi:uncharacterized SAM-binding protein YcdF (DUF218 family)
MRRRLSTLSNIKTVCLAGLTIPVGLWGAYVTALPSLPDISEIPQSVPASQKAIVIFTGSDERYAHGFRLFNQGHGNTLIISGVPLHHNQFTLGRKVGEPIIPPKEGKILVDYAALDTQDNAHNTCIILRRLNEGRAREGKQPITHVTLVTSFSHGPRAVSLLHQEQKNLKWKISWYSSLLHERAQIGLSERFKCIFTRIGFPARP